MKRSSKLTCVWFLGQGKTSALALEWLVRTEPTVEVKVGAPLESCLAFAAEKERLLCVNIENKRWADSFRGVPNIVISFLMPYHIPQFLLRRSQYGGVNFHPAPLPNYRGINCSTFAILNNESSFGVTCHYMSDRFDDGPILESRPVYIDSRDTAMSLEAKSKALLLDLFCSVVSNRAWEDSSASTCPHPPPGKLYTAKQFSTLARIDDLRDPQIDRRIRAFWNPPRSAAYFEVNGVRYFLCPSNQFSKTCKSLIPI